MVNAVELGKNVEANFNAGCEGGRGINGFEYSADGFSTRCRSLYKTPWMNLILQADGDHPDLEKQVRATISEYENAPMLWRVGPASANSEALGLVLEKSGLIFSCIEPALRLSLDKFKESGALERLRIEEMSTAKHVEDFLIPFCEGFSVPTDVADHFRILGRDRVIGSKNQKWFVGYFDGQVAASATWFANSGVNMIYNICTVETFRRRGIARRMVDHVVKSSLAHFQQPVCLFSSEAGLSLYESIGFELIFYRTDYAYQPDNPVDE